MEPARESGRAVERRAAPERPPQVHEALQPPEQPLQAPERQLQAVLPPQAQAAPAPPEAAPRVGSPRPATPAARVEPPAPPDPLRAEVRGVSLIVPAEPAGDRPAPRIELHLAERAGEVYVTVRTPNPQVREVLRSELPVLIERLEQSGYRAEVFSPAAERPAGTAETQVARAGALPESGGRDPMSWGFEEGRRQRGQEGPPHPPPRSKSGSRSFFHEFFR
jgi:hypothetical protein